MISAIRFRKLMQAEVAANGTVSEAFGGLVDGATGVGSCTLSDTSLYTFAIVAGYFKTAPMVICTPIGILNLAPSTAATTTAVVIRGTQVADGSTKVAGAFQLMLIGECVGLHAKP